MEGLVCECSALLEIETEQVSECVRQVLMTAGKKCSANQGSYKLIIPWKIERR